MIKAVVQAIPTYSMACFRILLSLSEELSGLMAKFWWGNQTDHRKIHWLSWERLSWPKEEGGMGLKDLHIFNLAMLAK